MEIREFETCRRCGLRKKGGRSHPRKSIRLEDMECLPLESEIDPAVRTKIEDLVHPLRDALDSINRSGRKPRRSDLFGRPGILRLIVEVAGENLGRG